MPESIKEQRVIYRTCISWPPCELDETPLYFRTMGEDDTPRKYTQEEIEAMKPQRRRKLLGSMGLSFNPTWEDAVRKFMESYSRQASKGLSQERLDAYAENRGTIVGAFIYKPEHGILTEFLDEHGNLFLYSPVRLKDIMLENWVPFKIDYLNYGKND